MSTPDLHTLTGAYSVHGLPEAERAQFERHLDVCEPCALEVRELTATAERLGLAVSAAPPSGLRERVLRDIATVRQDPPQVTARPERTGGGLGRRARALRHFGLAAALAAAAALGGVAVWQHQSAQDAQQRADRTQARATTLARVLAAPDAKVTTGELADGGTAAVVVSRQQDRAAFFASDLPRPPSGQVYQLWFSEDGAMRPAGLLDPSSAADTVLMTGAVSDASGMGITLEPAGGSPQPTSDPLAEMPFARA